MLAFKSQQTSREPVQDGLRNRHSSILPMVFVKMFSNEEMLVEEGGLGFKSLSEVSSC